MSHPIPATIRLLRTGGVAGSRSVLTLAQSVRLWLGAQLVPEELL